MKTIVNIFMGLVLLNSPIAAQTQPLQDSLDQIKATDMHPWHKRFHTIQEILAASPDGQKEGLLLALLGGKDPQLWDFACKKLVRINPFPKETIRSILTSSEYSKDQKGMMFGVLLFDDDVGADRLVHLLDVFRQFALYEGEVSSDDLRNAISMSVQILPRIGGKALPILSECFQRFREIDGRGWTALKGIRVIRAREGIERDALGLDEIDALRKRLTEAGEGINQPIRGKSWVSPTTNMEFLWIEALGFWVGKFEVTNDEYRKKEPWHRIDDFMGIYPMNEGAQPAVSVSFLDASEYTCWMTERERILGALPKEYRYRLPTDAEWLVFSQCGDDRKYPWGNKWPPQSGAAGNYADRVWGDALDGPRIEGYSDNYVVTCQVGDSFKNDWGLYGVGGNVGELTAAYNEKGVEVGSCRGGSWVVWKDSKLTCAYSETDYTDVSVHTGFRVILTMDGVPKMP